MHEPLIKHLLGSLKAQAGSVRVFGLEPQAVHRDVHYDSPGTRQIERGGFRFKVPDELSERLVENQAPASAHPHFGYPRLHQISRVPFDHAAALSARKVDEESSRPAP